jgi:lysophospholipase L1-like esterase
MKILFLLAVVHLAGAWSPFWRGRTMTDEPILFIEPSTSGPRCANLLFPPMSQPLLKHAGVTFVSGVDFTWSPGSRSVCLTPRSRIPTLQESRLFPWRNLPESVAYMRGTRWRYVMHSEKGEFQRFQIWVSYETNEKNWPLQSPSAGRLPRTMAALGSKVALNVVAIGDSITAGDGASKLIGIPPYRPGYADQIASALKESYKSAIVLQNHGNPGENCEWGLKVAERLTLSEPALFLIAFGMNDGARKRGAIVFGGCIKKLVAHLSARFPRSEFILVSNMPANPAWSGDAPTLFTAYRDELLKLEHVGLVVADVLEIWREILKSKKYLDLTGNGVNHPNDFGHRIYADAILSHLLYPGRRLLAGSR